MNDLGTVSAVFYGVLVEALAQAGADTPKMLADMGVAPDSLGNPDGRIAADAVFRTFLEAPARTGDDAFGLHAAESVPEGAFEVLEYATRTSPTVREGLERVGRYYALVHERTEVRVEEAGETARVTHRLRAPIEAPRTHVRTSSLESS